VKELVTGEIGMKFREKLKRIGACQEAIDWVGDKSPKEAWMTCGEMFWMYWFVEYLMDYRYLSHDDFSFIDLQFWLTGDADACHRMRGAVPYSVIGEAIRKLK